MSAQLDAHDQMAHPQRLAGLTDSEVHRHDGVALLRKLGRDGYLLMRGLLDQDRVLAVRDKVLRVLCASGWVDAADGDDARVGSGARKENRFDPAWLEVYAKVQAIQTFHELAYEGPLIDLMERVLGAPLLVHPRKMLRIKLPSDHDEHSPAHQDFRVVQGAVDTLTAWLPLGRCPPDLGGLRILPGLHKVGLVPVTAAANIFGQAANIADSHPGWATVDFAPGDVVVFHSLTLHSGMPNRTRSVRLSADFRYQLASDAVTTGSLLPYYFPWIPGWEELTVGWKSRAAIRRPMDLTMAPTFDPHTPNLSVPVSRLLTTGGPEAALLLAEGAQR